MYTLYITNKRYSSWSMRPWVLLKALDIPFEEKLVLAKASVRQTHFLDFSPTGKVPCLYDTGSNVIVWESLAVCEYIAEDHPDVWPADRAQRAFARAAASEMHAGFNTIRDECGMCVGYRIDLGGVSEALQKDLDRFSELFKEGLTKFGGPWIAGDKFCVADAFFAPIACRLKTYCLTLPDAVSQDYMERLFAHPAVDIFVQQGLRETEREPLHEEDVLRDRKVLEDFCK